MEDIVKDIVRELNESLKERGEYADLGDKRYKPVRISRENFHAIGERRSGKRIAFVDGGSLELVRAPNFSVQLVRVYYCIYQNNKRVKAGKNEFYAAISAKNKEGRIVYAVRCYPHNSEIEALEFDSFDKSLRIGSNRVEIDRVGGIIRRVAEIKAVCEIEADIIVMDGDLKAERTFEREWLEKLFEEATRKSRVIAAISKTSELLTDNGGSLMADIMRLGGEGRWYYYPVAENGTEEHKADIYIVKLNERGEHVFKLEAFNGISYDANEIMALLAENSEDPVFLGYPYGLIDADRNARVSKKEKEMLLTQIMVKAGDSWKDIRRHLNSLNAHEILDNIS